MNEKRHWRSPEKGFSGSGQQQLQTLKTGEMNMAFSVERIPAEAREGFLSEHRVYQDQAAAVLTPDWVIDHQPNAAMAFTGKVGGAYEGTQQTEYYSLYWNGEQIRLAADPLKTDFTESGAVMNWRIHAVSIPSVLHDQREAVLALVRDAFRAVGEVFDGHRYADVNVRFDLPSAN